MKFTRNARIVRGHLDAAPAAGVFFCLLIFVLLTSLVYTPGVRIHLPQASGDFTGVDGPSVAVAMDANGWLYFENQVIEQPALLDRLRDKVRNSTQPVTLIIAQDKDVTVEKQMALYNAARAAGIKDILYEVRTNRFDFDAGTPP
jgi:biopolymer transport protein ExbD